MYIPEFLLYVSILHVQYTNIRSYGITLVCRYKFFCSTLIPVRPFQFYDHKAPSLTTMLVLYLMYVYHTGPGGIQVFLIKPRYRNQTICV